MSPRNNFVKYITWRHGPRKDGALLEMVRPLFVLVHTRSSTDSAIPKHGLPQERLPTAPMSYLARRNERSHNRRACSGTANQDLQTTNLGVGGSNPSGRAKKFSHLAGARRTNLYINTAFSTADLSGHARQDWLLTARARLALSSVNDLR